jgi:tRNA threonylcarbamoyl adenosine modification protein (Sua5/YciO/YrdC/YwlC family)
VNRRVEIHPDNPQARLIRQAVDVIRDGGVIIYPTDSCYALACGIGHKGAMERIRRLRQLDDNHHFTLVCRDLSDISTYAKVDNGAYRLLKAHTPGPYTFLLKATHEVPRRLQHSKRKTIGLRVPDHAISQALLTELGEPMLSTTLLLPGDHLPMSDPHDIEDRMSSLVDLIVLAGSCGVEPTTVVDLESGIPEVVRYGKGDATVFED